jgi:hypothetical protein
VSLPIFDAMFGARGSQPALPSSQGYTNGTFINNLSQGEAGRLAQSLASNVNYACRLYGSSFGPCATRGFDAAGPQPINFWYANPFATGGSLNLVDDGSYSRYNAMQLQMRRRYAEGVTATVNYTLGYNKSDTWADNATQSANYQTLRDKKLNYGPSPFDVRHVLQTYGTYDLPFGKDRHFNMGNAVVNGILGDWVIGGILTAQSGSPFRLSSGRQTLNQEDAGVVLAPGVSVKDLQNLIGNYPGPGLNRYFIDPKVIAPDGRANSAYLLAPTTPGVLGQIIYLRTPASWNLDASLNKTVPLTTSGASLTIHLNVLNALNHPVWSTGPAQGGIGLGFLTDASITSTTFGQVARPLNGSRRIVIRSEIKF